VLLFIHLAACSLAGCAESVGRVTDFTGAAPWMWMRVYFIGFFTFEAALRMLSNAPLTRSLCQPMFYLDLLVVLPFWLRLLLYPDSVHVATYLVPHARPVWLRVFEAAGEFRLMKLSRNSTAVGMCVARGLDLDPTSARAHMTDLPSS
jgi:hypothetical protein